MGKRVNIAKPAVKDVTPRKKVYDRSKESQNSPQREVIRVGRKRTGIDVNNESFESTVVLDKTLNATLTDTQTLTNSAQRKQSRRRLVGSDSFKSHFTLKMTSPRSKRNSVGSPIAGDATREWKYPGIRMVHTKNNANKESVFSPPLPKARPATAPELKTRPPFAVFTPRSTNKYPQTPRKVVFVRVKHDHNSSFASLPVPAKAKKVFQQEREKKPTAWERLEVEDTHARKTFQQHNKVTGPEVKETPHKGTRQFDKTSASNIIRWGTGLTPRVAAKKTGVARVLPPSTTPPYDTTYERSPFAKHHDPTMHSQTALSRVMHRTHHAPFADSVASLMKTTD